MAVSIPVSQAKARLAELLRAADDEDVVLLRHGQPVGVVLSARRHAELMATLDDLEDRLSVHERTGVTTDFGKLVVELGV